jgi:hypothetical protein
MDKYYYGADATYMIYDGINAAYMTLMSRDLKVAKASGIVEENSYSDEINLDDEKTIILTANGNDVNYYYLGMDEGDSIEFKQGDVDADAFLGYAVNVYAKKNVNGTYTLLAIAKDSARNNEVAFDVDMFSSISGNKLTYEKENGSDATVTVAANPTIIINGMKAESTSLSEVFEISNTGKIYADNDWVGQVTLIDTADTTGYEVVNVELAAVAVVKAVSASGQISFQSAARVPYVDASGALNGTKPLAYLKVEEDEPSKILDIAKNGEAYDYTELEQWDVLVIKNVNVNGNNYGLTTVEVLDATSYIDGYVSATRNSQSEVKLSDGNWYDVDTNNTSVKNLESGDSGRFYIAYGNVVALNDDVKVEGVETLVADNYAYVIEAIADEDKWGNPSVILQILDKTGAIYEVSLATTTQFVNFDQIDDTVAKNLATIAEGLNTSDSDYATDVADAKVDFSLDLKDAYTIDKALTGKLADAMINQMISYTASSNGQIKAVTFTQSADEEKDMYLKANTTDVYDEDAMELGNVELDENTIVFYVSDALSNGTVTYGANTNKASIDYSSVSTVASLAEVSYRFVALDTVDGAAKAVVILNTTGALSPSANVAVIDGVGETVVGGDKVKIVEYYMNGELQSATTDPDVDELDSADKGDVYQIKVNNGVITAAKALMTYDRTKGSVATNTESVIDPELPANDGTGTVFGAITSISKKGNLNLNDGAYAISAADAEVANVYVLDPNKKEEYQLYVSSISEAYVDETVTKDAIGKSLEVDYKNGPQNKDITVSSIANVYELLDYAFAYIYDDDAIDIVIYKAYAFDYTLK